MTSVSGTHDACVLRVRAGALHSPRHTAHLCGQIFSIAHVYHQASALRDTWLPGPRAHAGSDELPVEKIPKSANHVNRDRSSNSYQSTLCEGGPALWSRVTGGAISILYCCSEISSTELGAEAVVSLHHVLCGRLWPKSPLSVRNSRPRCAVGRQDRSSNPYMGFLDWLPCQDTRCVLEEA